MQDRCLLSFQVSSYFITHYFASYIIFVSEESVKLLYLLFVCEESMHRFSRRVGRNIVLKNSDSLAERSGGYDGGLVISSEPLTTDDLFQVVVSLAEFMLRLEKKDLEGID